VWTNPARWSSNEEKRRMTPEPANPTLPYARPRVESPSPRSNPLVLACLFAALVLGGLACPMLAEFVFWGGASRMVNGISGAAVAAAPLSGVAWALRRTRNGRALALGLLAVAIVADVNLVSALWHADINLAWVARSRARAVLGWAVLWTIWQALALAAALVGRTNRR
jgi:hypothetical protein